MKERTIRALHVFGLLSRTGGAEKWMMDILRCKHSEHDDRLQIDFLLNLDDGPLVQEVRTLGANVHLVPFSRSPLPWSWGNPYLKSVRRLLRSQKYDVVHTHQFDLSGEILRIASDEGIPVRAMSIHATEYENPRFYRRWVHRLWGHPWILKYATLILPCSQAVARSFFSSEISKNDRTKLLYTGIDTNRFREAIEKSGPQNGSRSFHSDRFLQEFHIPTNAVVIGHVGRFVRQKNHAFLIDLLESMMHKNSNLFAVLVGRGELLDEMRRRVREKGLETRILLPGAREDVPELLTSLFDVFVLPSLYEGLPIAAFEALACGLSVVLSDRVSEELNRFFPERIVQIPLEVAPTRWADEIDKMSLKRIRPAIALQRLEQTPFTIRNSLNQLISLYENGLKKLESSSPEEFHAVAR